MTENILQESNLNQVGSSMSNKGSFIGEWGVLTMIVAKMTKQKDGRA